MIKQDDKKQKNAEGQISELENYSHGISELGTKDLAIVSGGGINIRGAFKGWSEASRYTNELKPKWDAFKFGLKDNKPGWKERVKDYAWVRVAGD